MTTEDTIDAEFTPLEPEHSGTGKGASRWIGGVALAIIALVVIAFVYWWASQRGAEGTPTPEATATLQRIENRVAALEASRQDGNDMIAASALDALRSRLDAAEARLAGLESATAEDAGPDTPQTLLTDLTARIDALEAQIYFDLPAGGTPAAARDISPTDLVRRISELESRLAFLPASTNEGAPQPLQDLSPILVRLEALEARATDAPSAPPVATRAIAELDQRIEALRGELRGQIAGNAPDSATDPALIARVERLSEALSVVSREATGVDLVATRAGPKTALAVQRLSLAIAEGRPFASEWKALGSTDLPATARSALDRNAASGVASRQSLRQRLNALTMARSTEKPDAIGQMRQVLGGVIERPDSETQRAEAALDNARGAMARGDLADAIAAFSGISGQPALDNWRNAATARLDVERALDALRSAQDEGGR